MKKRTPRLSKPELFAHVGYTPHPGQLLVHQSTAPRRVVACGSRWGKTTCASMEIVAALLEPRERSLGWIVAPSYELSNRIFRQVAETVRANFEHRIQHLDMRHQRLIVTNLSGGKSEVRGKSTDRPTGLLGEGLEWMVIEEAARLSDDLWSSFLSQRLVDRKGWSLAISTPMGAKGWFYKTYRHARRDATYAAWRCPSESNPHLDAAVIEGERRRLPEDVFRQEYGAEFIGEHLEPCDTCRGPSPHVPGLVVVFGKAEFLRCSECTEPVDDKGRTIVALGHDGGRWMKIHGVASDREPGIMYCPPYPQFGAA